jgi:hypothetical protein
MLSDYQESDQHSKRSTREIDPIVIQPFPAADVNGLCAAGVERMFLCLFLIGGTEIHGLHGRAEK